VYSVNHINAAMLGLVPVAKFSPAEIVMP